jgi:hypothetical protein
LGISGDTATFKETTNYLSSVTGRLGYARDRWLCYVKGGAAWAGSSVDGAGTTRRTTTTPDNEGRQLPVDMAVGHSDDGVLNEAPRDMQEQRWAGDGLAMMVRIGQAYEQIPPIEYQGKPVTPAAPL